MRLEDLIDAWRTLDSEDTLSYIRRGEILTKAKQSLPHGAFGDFLNDIDCKPRTAARFMKVYTVTKKVPALAHLQVSPSKLDVLSRLPLDALCAYILDSGPAIEGMSVRDLEKAVRAMLHPAEEEHSQEDDAETTEADAYTVTIELEPDYYQALKEIRAELFPRKTLSEMCEIFLFNVIDGYWQEREKEQFRN